MGHAERFVALLRGVNVGRGNRVPMADLRALLAGLGYGDVRTLLNSGNVVFEGASGKSARHAEAIRKALAEAMKVDVLVVVKSAGDVEAVVAENPLVRRATDPSRLLVAFTADAVALAALRPLGALVEAPEAFHVGRHAAYLWCPNGSLKSKAGEALLGRAGKDATTRNWATVGKIRQMMSGSP